MQIKINFDGACNNHNKIAERPMGIGLAVFINNEYCEKSSNFILYIGTKEEPGTSNIAEWKACVEAMRKAASYKIAYPLSSIEIFSDSQLIANQFNEIFDINVPAYKNYFLKAKRFALIADVQQVKWVKRELNKEADKLSKRALQEIPTE